VNGNACGLGLVVGVPCPVGVGVGLVKEMPPTLASGVGGGEEGVPVDVAVSVVEPETVGVWLGVPPLAAAACAAVSPRPETTGATQSSPAPATPPRMS
jgi:hypothetical protein